MKIPSIRNIKDRIYQLPFIRWIIDWMKTNSLPGFFGVPIYDVLVFILNEIKDQRLIVRANAIAFSFFLSLFPALISLITMFPILEKYFLKFFPSGQNFESLLTTFRLQFKELIPGGVFDTVEDVALNPRFGLLSIGFVLAIFFASNGVMSMMNSFDKSYAHTFKRRSGFWKRILAIGLTFLIFLLVIASVLLVILGQMILHPLLERFQITGFESFLLNGLRYIIVIGFFYFVITSIYRYGAATFRRFRVFSAGATLATLLSLVSSLLFSYYVEAFDTYNKLYGSIGTIIVTMLWIQINAFVLLVGFELNASIAVNRDLKLKKAEAEE